MNNEKAMCDVLYGFVEEQGIVSVEGFGHSVGAFYFIKIGDFWYEKDEQGKLVAVSESTNNALNEYYSDWLKKND